MLNKAIPKKNKISIFLTEIIRIKDVAYWFSTSLLGFILGISILSITKYFVSLLIFTISTFFSISFTFAINNYYDIESDKNNPRRRNVNALALGEISKINEIILNLVFLAIPIIFCIIYQDITIIIVCILLLFMGWVYSAPPLRLKGRPIIDIVWHFFGFFLIILWGALFTGQINNTILLVAISAGIFSCIFQICNHILDYDYDNKSGTTTFAVWAGLDTTKTVLKIFIWIHLFVIIPIILLYSMHYISTIIIVLGGVGVGIYKSKPKNISHSKKHSFISFLFYFTISVYISCALYHILSLANIPPLHFFDVIIIR
ncbi:MAG: prenyltransferase [Euryarchaeota archaeon]|nr:prenyltransferase [Euryarchaeota archaeon]